MIIQGNPGLNSINQQDLLDIIKDKCNVSGEVRSLTNCLKKCKKLDNDSMQNYVEKILAYYRSSIRRTGDGLYNANYISMARNVSIEEAEKIVEEIKSSKSTSLENFIKRHGEEKGRAIFSKFLNTSNWRANYAQEHGQASLKQKNKTCSKRSIEYWLKRGYSKEEAILEVSNYQKNNSGLHSEYYEARGYSDDEIQEIFDEINKKKDSLSKVKVDYIETYGYPTWRLVYATYCNLRNDNKSVGYFKRRYGNEWQTELRKSRARHRNGKYIKPEEYSNWKKYKLECWYLTELEITIHRNKIPDIEKRGADFHLDHRYSIFDGFRNQIDPMIIANCSNLKIITAKDNLSKGIKSSKTIEELISDYRIFEKEFSRESKENRSCT